MSVNSSNLSISNLVGSDAAFAFGESTYREGDVFGPMTGFQLEAVYLRTGHVEIRSDGKSFQLSSPGIALVASQHTLEYRYGPASMCNVLWCQYISGGLDAARIAAIVPSCGPMQVSPAAASLMKIGADIPADIYGEMRSFSSALGIAVLEELLVRKTLETTAAEVPRQVQLVRRYIEEHLSGPVTTPVLAEVSGLSPQHLNRLYKAAFGENPLEYLWRLRVRRGAYLLQHTGMRISQIAYQTGFKTPNHFSRLIKKRYQLSPRELRAQKWRGRVSDADEAIGP
ncbi:MAG: helix-turn-helix domain-containing protein [Leisingera sp.]